MADEDAKSGVIRLRLREAAQMFNSLDPDPFIERDLDDDAAHFITSWAREIPRHHALTLRVEITEPKPGVDHQAQIEQGTRNYFDQMAQLTRNEFRDLMRRGRASLAIGLVVLVACFAVGHAVYTAFGHAAWAELVREGFMIGGWVAMWRPLEILLYDWWPLRRRRLDFERLRDMKVEVTVKPKPQQVGT